MNYWRRSARRPGRLVNIPSMVWTGMRMPSSRSLPAELAGRLATAKQISKLLGGLDKKLVYSLPGRITVRGRVYFVVRKTLAALLLTDEELGGAPRPKRTESGASVASATATHKPAPNGPSTARAPGVAQARSSSLSGPRGLHDDELDALLNNATTKSE